tara:strand:+ start:75 stop:305 length:231 start_codon:yes stop_codon:yes gene_type:complete
MLNTSSVKIEKENLIQFVNFVNECCSVMDDDYVAEWITTPNSNLNMEAPIDLINEEVGIDKLYRLLYFIDIGEADL